MERKTEGRVEMCKRDRKFGVVIKDHDEWGKVEKKNSIPVTLK